MLLYQSLRQQLGRTASSAQLCRQKLHARTVGSSMQVALSSTTTSTSAQILPWRHDPSLPERVLQHNDYSGAFNPTARDPPILRKLIAARELNISAWDVLPIPFYKHEWESDLATGFAVAFEFAVGELLGTLFRVSVNDDNGVIVDSSQGSSNSSPTTTIDNNEYLKNMMDKKLLAQFNQSIINPEDYQIKFSLRPFQAELQNIFAVPVPGLTRDIVEEKQYLKGAIYRLHNAYDENGFDENYFDLVTEFAKEVGYSKRTVIAEASVKCKEFFQVKDKNTGQVIQGMEDDCEEEEVIHLARFEVVTDEAERGERVIGAWKLIDVDDLLEGNRGDLDKGGPSSGKIACALFSPALFLRHPRRHYLSWGVPWGNTERSAPKFKCPLSLYFSRALCLELPAQSTPSNHDEEHACLIMHWQIITMQYSSCDIVTLLLAVSSASIINSAGATATSSAFQLLPTKRTWKAPFPSSSLQSRFHTDSSSSRPLSSLILPLESVQIASKRIAAATELYASKNEENVDNNNIEEESNNNNDGDGDDDSYISKRYPNPHQTSWAYS
eukprot:scaffold33535_cov134-Skeletonema_dohrnii-CCMP3373.AAC.1